MMGAAARPFAWVRQELAVFRLVVQPLLADGGRLMFDQRVDRRLDPVVL